MPVVTDFVNYHQSVADELKATQNRIRDLIGSNHWATDGEHKEAALRKTLRSSLPESLHIGRGFVCYEEGPSTQLDVLITRKDMPTLFKDGDLVLVTPDCVEAIVEVKTRLDSQGELAGALTKLAYQVQRVRESKPDQRCWAGLFVFDGPQQEKGGAFQRKSRSLLEAVFEAGGGDECRVVNCVALGLEIFVRYWPRSASQGFTNEPVWHAYIFSRGTHERLAPAYFISNLVWGVSPDTSADMGFAWFPIPREEGGKERYRSHYIQLRVGEVNPF